MNRRILPLILALLALAGSLGWLLRQKWLDALAHEQAVFGQPADVRASPPPARPAAASVIPADYLEVAQKTLFSKDRNPSVWVDLPSPKPDPPLPPLPIYWGQMSIGDPVVILTAAKAPEQKSYRAGDSVGDFKLVAFNNDSITFDWNGKQVERMLRELAPKDSQQPEAAASALPVAPAQITGIAPVPPQEATVPPTVGVDMGAGFHGCVAGDNSPAGTVAGGYKKVIGQSLMGPSCHWEQVK